MKRKIFCVLLLTVFLSQNIYASNFKFIFSQKSKPVFKEDVKSIYADTENHWCEKSAQKLFDENIYRGEQIGKNYYFNPERQVTRGEFLLFMSALLNKKYQNENKAPFSDYDIIPFWQKQTVNGMYNDGIIFGNDENGKLYFNYDEKISRVEAAGIISRAVGIREDKSETNYSDSYLFPKYASEYIKSVNICGIMKGYEDKSFRPYVKVTMAMLADILCNLKDYCEKNPKVFGK